MKIKIAVCAVMALLFAPAVSQARWGTEFTGQSWKMDGREYITTLHTAEAYAANPSNGTSMTGKVTEGKIGGAASLFVEGNSRFRLGLSAGYGVMPLVSSKISSQVSSLYVSEDLKSQPNYIPVDLYLKYNSKGGKFSIFGGGGGDYIMADTTYKYWANNGPSTYFEEATFTQKKVVPHVQAGCELFLAKWISLNVSAKYLFNAVFDNLTGKLKAGGVTSANKYKLVMVDNSTYGEEFAFASTSQPLTSGERPFKYDFSGLRANVGLRIYFH